MMIQVLVTIIALIAALGLVKRMKKGSIGLLAGISWTAVWILAIIVVWNPLVSNRLASWLGVGRGADAVLYSAVVILLYALLRLHARMESLEHALSELVKKIALDRAFQKDSKKDPGISIPDQQ